MLERLSVSPLEAALRLTRDQDALELRAQPIIDTTTGAVAGYEALSRFPHEWNVNPQDLFTTAEDHGLSPQLSVTVLRKALALRDQLPPRTFLTVNCSPRDLASPEVGALLESADLHRVFVELTESAWPDDEAAVLAAAATVRRRGGRIAADDVGAGYAGLLQLVRLRPELVKLDREIVQRVEHDAAATALVEMLGALVGRLDGWLVAEGVETVAQLERVVMLGVPLVQGYLLGIPEVPWAGGRHGERIQQLQRRVALTEHLVAYRRDPLPGELVLGEDGEVTGVVLEVGGGELRTVRPLTMAASTTVSSAVLRVMSRNGALERVAPVVLTDDVGRPTGVVPVERLVAALAAED